MVSLSLPSRGSTASRWADGEGGVGADLGPYFRARARTSGAARRDKQNVTEEDILRRETAFGFGKTSVKLYFMQGLPTETLEDLDGIAAVARAVVGEYYRSPGRPKGRRPTVTVSVSNFIPKPFTPFQWEAQDSPELLREKQEYLKYKLGDRNIRYQYHDVEPRMSRLCGRAGTEGSRPRLSVPAKRAFTLTPGTSILTTGAGLRFLSVPELTRPFMPTASTNQMKCCPGILLMPE